MANLLQFLGGLTGVFLGIASLLGLLGFATRRTRLKRKVEVLRACSSASDPTRRRSLALAQRQAEAELIADVLVPRWRGVVFGVGIVTGTFASNFVTAYSMAEYMLPGKPPQRDPREHLISLLFLTVVLVGGMLVACKVYETSEELMRSVAEDYLAGARIDSRVITREISTAGAKWHWPSLWAWELSLGVAGIVTSSAAFWAMILHHVDIERYNGIVQILGCLTCLGILGVGMALAGCWPLPVMQSDEAASRATGNDAATLHTAVPSGQVLRLATGTGRRVKRSGVHPHRRKGGSP